MRYQDCRGVFCLIKKKEKKCLQVNTEEKKVACVNDSGKGISYGMPQRP